MKRRITKIFAMLAITAMLLADLAPLENDGSWFSSLVSSVSTFVSEKINDVRKASAEETVYYSFLMGTASISDGGVIDYSLYSTSDRSLSIVLRSSAGIASGTAITWMVSNDNIVQIDTQDDDTCSVKLKILSPGYSGLSVSLRDTNGTIYSAVAYCSIYVPLEWSDNEENGNNNIMVNNASGQYYGLLIAQNGEGEENRTLQMYTKESSDFPEGYHYLRKLRYVDYQYTAEAKAAGKSGFVPSDVDPADLENPGTALVWESSDPSVVEVDSLTGMITAISAGFARVTVTTKTVNEKRNDNDSLEFNVVVVPQSYMVDYTTDYQTKYTVVTDPTKEQIIIQSNAAYADTLRWELYQGDTADVKKDITKKYADKMEVSSSSGRVILNNLPAGVYHLTAIPVKDATASRLLETYGKGTGGLKACNIQYMGITIVVPLNFPTKSIIMNYYNDNVFDTFDLLSNSNLPDGAFRFYSEDIEIAKVGLNDGVVEAAGIGETTVRVSKVSDKIINDTFGVYASSSAAIRFDGNDILVNVKVVNGITLSNTSETMPLGSTLQLTLTAPNPYQGDIKWSTSDGSVVTVDDTGLVTAVGVGDANVTVRIKVGGVTKQARCRIKVIDSVNKIELTAKQDYCLVGDNLTISATISPKLNGIQLVWACSDETIASVADTSALSMTITGVKEGTVVVSALNKENSIVATKIIKVIQEIQSVTLSDKEVTLPITTGFYQLYATCKPSLPSSQKLKWSSSNPKIVTVDDNGKVKLVKPGSAVITVTTENGKMDQCTFTVLQGVTAINLDEKDILMFVGEKHRITYTIKPDNASNVNLKWNTVDSKIATIDASGYITAKNVGSTVITVQTTDGTGLFTMCTVTVMRNATSIKLDVTSLQMNVGDVYNLEATLTPADSSDEIAFESSNSKVATVSSRGKITAKAKGNCVIIAKTAAGMTAYVNVTVSQQVTGLKLNSNEAEIYVGDELELVATIEPKTASDVSVTWTSSKSDIASVDDRGKVKGLKGGTTLIKCVSVDGEYMSYCIVTVLERVTDVFIQDQAEVGVGKRIKLEATVAGETATNKNVTWSSSDRSIATVNEKGYVTGVSVGKCMIIVTAMDGSGEYAECELTVFSATDSIDIDPEMTYIELIVGESKQIEFTTSPNVTTYQPTWTSNDTSIAVVNQKGRITGLKAGTTTVIAAAPDDPDVTATVIVKVSNPVYASNVTFDNSELIMTAGESKNVVATFTPGNITESYTWSTDNPSVAVVDANGRITARQVGTATITLMTQSGKKGTVTVYVVGLSETSVTLYQYEKLLLNLEIDGGSQTKLTVRWGTSNQEIAEMRNGQVTAKALGTTTVYAMVNGRKLECRVKVISNLN
ncbi:MAG: Ig-like domain-containing protein [Lachnospiraceae bacterium]|nr:Ig-like domain-containing protein [Lachnospiraceae bacterium]